MDTRKVIEVNRNIRESKKREIAYLKEIIDYSKEIIGECNHEIVVRMRFGRKMMVPVDTYYCPACDAYYNTACDCDLSLIKNSKIIDLTDMMLEDSEETLDVIKEEIVDHYDKYLEGCDYKDLRTKLMGDMSLQRTLD
jgi:hypothetical protein